MCVYNKGFLNQHVCAKSITYPANIYSKPDSIIYSNTQYGIRTSVSLISYIISMCRQNQLLIQLILKHPVSLTFNQLYGKTILMTKKHPNSAMIHNNHYDFLYITKTSTQQQITKIWKQIESNLCVFVFSMVDWYRSFSCIFGWML